MVIMILKLIRAKGEQNCNLFTTVRLEGGMNLRTDRLLARDDRYNLLAATYAHCVSGQSYQFILYGRHRMAPELTPAWEYSERCLLLQIYPDQRPGHGTGIALSHPGISSRRLVGVFWAIPAIDTINTDSV